MATHTLRATGCFSKIMSLATHPGQVQEFTFVTSPHSSLLMINKVCVCLMQSHLICHANIWVCVKKKISRCPKLFFTTVILNLFYLFIFKRRKSTNPCVAHACLAAFWPGRLRLLPDVQQRLWWRLQRTRRSAHGQLQSDASWALCQR